MYIFCYYNFDKISMLDYILGNCETRFARSQS